MKEGKYTKTLAKIQVLRFFFCEIFREMFYLNLQSFVWRRHVGPPLIGDVM